ncbi:MAG: UvrD-helicase domain-containing protein, partial [bacterium]
MELDNGINPQNELVDSTEGIHLVDAGAGTGKTWAIIERYKMIIEKKTDPKDILLVTFTVNAANQMKEEVLRKLSDKINVTQLLEAPIMNFHAYCSRLLSKFGTDAPSYLGINDILSNFRIIEDKDFEQEMFRDFYSGFTRKHSEKYHKIFLSLDNDHASVLQIIKKLCSVGIFPHSEGWLNEDREKLSGNYEMYSELFDKENEPLIGKGGGPVLNNLRKKFVPTSKRRIYLDFNRNVILEKTILPDIKEDSFKDATQEALIEFTRDVYFEYIEYLLKRNSLNYEFMIMFAYLILYYNKKIRESQQFDYVMIDEFQDTDEIQFKIIMLLCKDIKGAANLCVVGDWKQGIYSFRNTDIENITKFTDNLAAYKKELNLDEER